MPQALTHKANSSRRSAWRQSLRDLGRVLQTPTLLLWAVYLLTFPIYVMPSGLPQPSAVALLILTPAVLSTWDGRLPRSSARAIRALALFIVYVSLSMLAWSVITGRFTTDGRYGFLLSPVFFIYNLLGFLVALLLYQKHGDRFIWLTARIMVLTVVVQVLVALVLASSSLRSTVLFNNPNQLGYFATLAATLIFLTQPRARLSVVASTIGVIGCTYLALISASKASLIAVALLASFATFQRLRTIVLTGLVAGVLVLLAPQVGGAIDRAQERISTDENQGFFLERGYDRITNHPEHWLLGAGEGGYTRFTDTTAIGGLEIHSSFGTIFFCYGVIGLTLFVMFLSRVVRGASWRQLLLLAPIAAYSVTHQGLRFTLFWVLLGVFACVKSPTGK